MTGVRDVVTLDGPAASGKSSVARRIADRLGCPFVSSGLLYRAATWLAAEAGVDPTDEAALVALLRSHDVRLEPDRDGNRIVIDGRDVSARLHTDAIDDGVSSVASHPGVRAWVNDRLREIAGPFVIDGRDMGRDVFPDAWLKLYLTADPEVRAARRVGERAADLGAIAEAIRRRDASDARQSVPAEDAVTLDTSSLGLDEVVERVMRLVDARRSGAAP